MDSTIFSLLCILGFIQYVRVLVRVLVERHEKKRERVNISVKGVYFE